MVRAEMKAILFFITESKWRMCLVFASLIAFIDTWSRFGFGATRETGVVAVAIHSLFYAFGGAIFGIMIAAVRFGIQKAMGKAAKFSQAMINVVWSIAIVSMLYKFIKFQHF